MGEGSFSPESAQHQAGKAQQFMRKHTVFLPPPARPGVERAKGWQRPLPTVGERGRCQDSVVYSWAMLPSPRPRHVAIFLVLVSCPLSLGGPRIIRHLIRRKWLAQQGDGVTQSLDWPTGTPVPLGECDPLSYPLPHGELGGSLSETSSIKVFSGLSIS